MERVDMVRFLFKEQRLTDLQNLGPEMPPCIRNKKGTKREVEMGVLSTVVVEVCREKRAYQRTCFITWLDFVS